MTEPTATPIKKEPEILKPSGNPAPSIEEIGMNIFDYEFRVNEFIIQPRVEIYKDNKMVSVITDSTIHKYHININPQYADQLIADITNDFKIGLQQKITQVIQARNEKAIKKGN